MEKRRAVEEMKAKRREEKRIQKVKSAVLSEGIEKKRQQEDHPPQKHERQKEFEGGEPSTEEASLNTASKSSSTQINNASNVIHQGWLDIRNGKEYEHRWFRLEGTQMKYFANPVDTSESGTENALGVIELERARVRRSRKRKLHLVIKDALVTAHAQFLGSDSKKESPCPQQQQLTTNILTLQYKKLLLKCPSKAQLKYWIQQIELSRPIAKTQRISKMSMRDSLSAKEYSTNSDSISESNNEDEKDVSDGDTLLTADEVSNDLSSGIEPQESGESSSMPNSESDSDEGHSLRKSARTKLSQSVDDAGDTPISSEPKVSLSTSSSSKIRRSHRCGRHLHRNMTINGAHDLPDISEDSTMLQIQHKNPRKSQSDDLTHRKAYTSDSTQNETKRHTAATALNQKEIDSVPAKFDIRTRRNSSPPPSQLPPEIHIIGPKGKDEDCTSMEQQQNTNAISFSSEDNATDKDEGFAYLENELQSAVDAPIQQTLVTTNDNILLKEDEIFSPKLEPLIRVPEHVPWNRAEWMNILVGRIFREMQTCKVFLNEIEDKLRDALDQLPKRNFLGPIQLHQFDFGNKQWDIKGIRCFKPFGSNNDELIGEVDVVFGEQPGIGIGLHLSTELYINWPKPKTATIPLTIYISITYFKGIAHFHFPSVLNSRMGICFVSPPMLEFDMTLDVGNNVRVSNISKLRKFCFSLMKKHMTNMIVYPSKLRVYIPLPGRRVDLIFENPLRPPKPRLPANGRIRPTRRDKPDAKARKFIFGIFIDQILNRGKFEVINEIIADDVLVHGMSLVGAVMKGKEAIKQMVTQMKTAFPDLVFYIEDLLADSVNVACRWVARGTHKGQIWDYPPTNEEMLLRGMFLAKVKEGNQKITDLYIYWSVSTVYSMV